MNSTPGNDFIFGRLQNELEQIEKNKKAKPEVRLWNFIITGKFITAGRRMAFYFLLCVAIATEWQFASLSWRLYHEPDKTASAFSFVVMLMAAAFAILAIFVMREQHRSINKDSS